MMYHWSLNPALASSLPGPQHIFSLLLLFNREHRFPGDSPCPAPPLNTAQVTPPLAAPVNKQVRTRPSVLVLCKPSLGPLESGPAAWCWDSHSPKRGVLGPALCSQQTPCSSAPLWDLPCLVRNVPQITS